VEETLFVFSRMTGTMLFCLSTGRLLRANQITFNWDRLASWINLTETWPYRTSWLILFLEETDGIPDQAALKTIYER
jgi:ankyrin repeat-rich membrane spanning protein